MRPAGPPIARAARAPANRDRAYCFREPTLSVSFLAAPSPSLPISFPPSLSLSLPPRALPPSLSLSPSLPGPLTTDSTRRTVVMPESRQVTDRRFDSYPARCPSRPCRGAAIHTSVGQYIRLPRVIPHVIPHGKCHTESQHPPESHGVGGNIRVIPHGRCHTESHGVGGSILPGAPTGEPPPPFPRSGRAHLSRQRHGEGAPRSPPPSLQAASSVLPIFLPIDRHSLRQPKT